MIAIIDLAPITDAIVSALTAGEGILILAFIPIGMMIAVAIIQKAVNRMS